MQIAAPLTPCGGDEERWEMMGMNENQVEKKQVRNRKLSLQMRKRLRR